MSKLIVPIDASQIASAEREGQRLRVAVQTVEGVRSQIVSVGADRTEVTLDVDPARAISVAIGPADATDDDMFHLQTLTAQVSPRQWVEKGSLTIAPFVLTPWWWRFWLRWCRNFVIEGRLVCAGTKPVPGAEVRAYDVDFFWWWSSHMQVGPTAITDANGHFTIKFRWCCGWWPWWWWALRHWRLEPLLIEKIQPVLGLNPRLRVRPPDAVPSLEIVNPSPRTKAGPIDPSQLAKVRDKLLSQLPHVPELERLKLWPWWDWHPWLDCTPDIIFRATQNCGGAGTKLIVNEHLFQTRWDIPTQLDVTLTANDQACCLPHTDPEPAGDCALLTGVCGDPGITVTNIGAPAVPPSGLEGYAYPGDRDRPFAEIVDISGQFGTSAQAAFYEIEYSPHGASPATWNPVPPSALLDFQRGYFDATQPWPHQWFYPVFQAKPYGARYLYESRHHYEMVNAPPNWGSAMTGRTWFYNVNTLASIQTKDNPLDGTMDFRIVGYQTLADGKTPDVANPHPLPGCGGNAQNNLLVLTIDNRVVGTPTAGNVHVNTAEPDCGITGVTLAGAAVESCGTHKVEQGKPLVVDFFVSDPDGHLDHYDLVLKYDQGSYKNLLDLIAYPGTLTSTPANQQGPDYAQAVTGPQTAARPKWFGGAMKLTIDNAAPVFPKTCCYLIELTVWKRNIANCHAPAGADDLSYYNQTHYSFTVTV
jgi:hypothetical protein